ncbi:MAG: SbcC/MukB-like Walker B domain-containing protein [Candidatus Nanopelagicales bacterium]
MLDGRLELHATKERTGRKLMGHGLGLEVLDLRTETLRKASTRSGGETFRAALALALGLADTGRANAGGIEIGMLVIDEGFGSLDPDRLDDVMAELQRLRKDGRVAGAISHVSEVKRGIAERIDVRPIGPRDGSALEVIWQA